MLQKIMERGPFNSGPLSVWRYVSFGSATPEGISLPDGLPELGDDDETPPPFVERSVESVTIHFHDVARFRIGLADRVITGFDIDPDTADCVIEHILNDHIAPRLLAELGELVLHASTVRFGDRVALFLGGTGAGKSTLAASLHQAGHLLLGDDAVVVTRHPSSYAAKAVYPSLRLYPEAIARLLGDAVQTAPMADYSDKQHVHLPDLPPSVGAPLPQPLAAIFFIARPDSSESVTATPLPSTMACIKLVEQSFTLDPRDARCAARRLAALSELALAVPTYTLAYPHQFERLDEVRTVIEGIMGAKGQARAHSDQEKLSQ